MIKTQIILTSKQTTVIGSAAIILWKYFWEKQNDD